MIRLYEWLFPQEIKIKTKILTLSHSKVVQWDSDGNPEVVRDPITSLQIKTEPTGYRVFRFYPRIKFRMR